MSHGPQTQCRPRLPRYRPLLEGATSIQSLSALVAVCFFFFFQAEDGIRDYKVTGVQTCALPISGGATGARCEAGLEYPIVRRRRCFAAHCVAFGATKVTDRKRSGCNAGNCRDRKSVV